MCAYRIEISPPDIAPYAITNTSIPYVTRFESGKPGPHLMINALTHGNELCGAVALDFLFKANIRPARGVLTLSFANVDAYARFNPNEAERSRYVEEDFNRLWDIETLEGNRSSIDLIRARQLRPVVEQADFLLDIHSLHHPTVPLSLCGDTRRGCELAKALAIPNWVVIDRGHAAGRRMRDYGPFGEEKGERTALLIECGQHWRRESCDVAIRSVLRFLHHFRMLDAEMAARYPNPEPDGPVRLVEVTETITARSSHFRFVDSFVGMEVIAKAQSVIGYDGDAPVRTPYDECVLIMPWGKLAPGQTAVRLGRFVS